MDDTDPLEHTCHTMLLVFISAFAKRLQRTSSELAKKPPRTTQETVCRAQEDLNTEFDT